MKKITLLLLLISYSLSSQNVSGVDQIIRSYPTINSPEELAERIDSDFHSDLEKVKATYAWLALNVNYYKERKSLVEAPEYTVYTDQEDLERRNQRKNEKLVVETFKSKKAVCKGYALSFQKICTLLKIESQLIKGYVKTTPNKIAFIPREKNHAWNAVRINNEWLFLDVTFGSGYSLNGSWKSKLDNYYFNIKKEELNLTHYPSEKKWLNFMEQKPLRQFCKKPVFNKPFFIANAKLLSPKEGKIVTSKKQKIGVKINGVTSETKISYSYGQKNKSKKAVIYDYGSYTEIIIESPSKDTNLNIFFDKELALQYKVVVR